MEAMENGELILSLSDDRIYEGAAVKRDGNTVVVIKESKTGTNELFFDTATSVMMTRNKFIAAINEGEYPSYTTRFVNGIQIPASKGDANKNNNLG